MATLEELIDMETQKGLETVSKVFIQFQPFKGPCGDLKFDSVGTIS